VVIPAYNAEDLVGNAIESILAQTVPVHEIIVVDDGSTDGTWKAVRRFGPHVLYLYQDNAGPSVARNTGIRAATGEWIAFLDTDDLWLPGKVESEAEVIAADPGLAWAAVNHYLRVFDTGEQFPRFDLERAKETLDGRTTLPSFVKAACLGLGWDPVGLLVRRDVLLDIGGFRPGLDYAEDLDLCLAIARDHPTIGFHSEPVAVHHVDRPGGLSQRQPVPMQMEVLRSVYERHLPAAAADGNRAHLETLFRTIVQDQLGTLLVAGQRLQMLKVCSHYSDMLPVSYSAAMAGLSLLPPGFRKALYAKLQWRIRG